jgi:hypothetical protein
MKRESSKNANVKRSFTPAINIILAVMKNKLTFKRMVTRKRSEPRLDST